MIVLLWFQTMSYMELLGMDVSVPNKVTFWNKIVLLISYVEKKNKHFILPH
jgi:hypothetical protein